jgi:transcriptional regulator GlxA family with amidase domain
MVQRLRNRDQVAPDAPAAALKTEAPKTIRVGFILQPHFSLVAFTGALDALVTANLVTSTSLFEYSTYGVDSRMVISDLGINISTDGVIENLQIQHRGDLDLLIVCGGFRCSLASNPKLNTCLRASEKLGIRLGGLWNGSVALAHAGLLDGQECAVHPDNHAFMKETFPNVSVSRNTLVLSPNRATCSGPVSALEMMLKLLNQLKGTELVRAVREVLSCDQGAESRDAIPLQMGDDPTLPESLRGIMELMRKNIDEPLTLVELAELSGVSRRQMERLFHSHLDSSPSRYYLELRLTHARRLLTQTNESITNVALASGFVSTSHFSNCYKDSFGISPSATRAKVASKKTVGA